LYTRRDGVGQAHRGVCVALVTLRRKRISEPERSDRGEEVVGFNIRRFLLNAGPSREGPSARLEAFL